MVFDHLVFRDADVYTCLLLLEKGTPDATHLISVKNAKDASDVPIIVETAAIHVSQSSWWQDDAFRFETRLIGDVGGLVAKLVDISTPLGDAARASLGCQAYNRSKHTPEQIRNRVFHADHKAGDEYLPELAGSDVGRYVIDRKKGQWIKYGPWLHDYRTMDWLQGSRILVREIPGKSPYRIQACYLEATYCNYKTILNVNPSEQTQFSMKYLCGLLNSRLISFIYPYRSNKIVAKSFPRISVGDLRRIPIRTIDFSDPAKKASHDRIIALVDRMLAIQKQLGEQNTPQFKLIVQRQIEETDRQIDALVYELYDLTEEEIRIVEESMD